MTPLPLGKLYTLGIRFQTGRVHSAAVVQQVLGLIGEGRLTPGAVTSAVIDWGAAPARYLDDTVKLVVTR
jgi:hypothetical protein